VQAGVPAFAGGHLDHERHLGEAERSNRRVHFRILDRRRAGFLSNSGMDTSQDAHRRLTELEIKASFTEDLLDQLNLTIYRQQEQIDSLLRQVALLRQQSPEPGTGGGARNLRDELPPHY